MRTHTCTTYMQDPLYTIIYRGGAVCENCGLLLLQQWWLDKADRGRDGHNPAQWQPAARSESQMQRGARGVSHTRVGTWLWWPRKETTSWHRPCATGAPLGTSPMWCRSCKVGVKMLTHCSTWVCSSFRGDSVLCTGLRHISSADNNFSGILNVTVCGMWSVFRGECMQWFPVWRPQAHCYFFCLACSSVLLYFVVLLAEVLDSGFCCGEW